MSEGPIRYEKKGDIAWIYMEDGKANALNQTSLQGLLDGLNRAMEEEALAVVLKGVGKCFSAGLDLKTLPTLSREDLRETLRTLYVFVRRLTIFERPVVAAVTGHAVAGGAVILLGCDYCVGANDGIKVGLNEVAISISMPTFLLELARGRLDTSRLFTSVLHGRIVGPQEAVQIGYLHEICTKEDVDKRAEDMAETLSVLPNPAYHVTKQRLRDSFLEQGEEDFMLELESFFNSLASS